MANLLKLETNQAKTYFKPADAVTDKGFGQKDDVFIKEGKEYKIKEYDHFNTTIYSVTMEQIN